MTQLDRAAVAARFGIKPASVTREVNRGSLPPPDGYISRSPWWWSTTLDAWERPGRTGRPAKMRSSAVEVYAEQHGIKFAEAVRQLVAASLSAPAQTESRA